MFPYTGHRLWLAISMRLTRAALLLAALVASTAYAAVGTIDSFEGDVKITSARGEPPASAGYELQESDTVSTGANAWALLAMSDGASLTLRSNTRLKLDTYRYDPKGGSESNVAVLSLLRGAFRSITGLIGKTNREGYRITTATATIGIRGTDHEPAYYPPAEPGQRLDREPGTYDKVNSGESFVRNEHGEVPIKAGQAAFVHHDGKAAPRLLDRVPAFYRQHAQLDKRAAGRRREFHQQQAQSRQQARRAERERATEQKQERKAAKKSRREKAAGKKHQ